MTQQATKCLELFYGSNPATIKKALSVQKPSIVEELKNHFGENNIDKLAQRLSLGK